MFVRVLIADSDVALLDAYRDFLSQNGFDVATATDGLACVAQLRGFNPDALVLEPDLLWGRGNGVLALLREGTDVPQVPVLLLTARNDAEVLALETDYPLCEYQRKPLAPQQLANRLHQLLERNAVPGGFFG